MQIRNTGSQSNVVLHPLGRFSYIEATGADAPPQMERSDVSNIERFIFKCEWSTNIIGSEPFQKYKNNVCGLIDELNTQIASLFTDSPSEVENVCRETLRLRKKLFPNNLAQDTFIHYNKMAWENAGVLLASICHDLSNNRILTDEKKKIAICALQDNLGNCAEGAISALQSCALTLKGTSLKESYFDVKRTIAKQIAVGLAREVSTTYERGFVWNEVHHVNALMDAVAKEAGFESSADKSSLLNRSKYIAVRAEYVAIFRSKLRQLTPLALVDALAADWMRYACEVSTNGTPDYNAINRVINDLERLALTVDAYDFLNDPADWSSGFSSEPTDKFKNKILHQLASDRILLDAEHPVIIGEVREGAALRKPHINAPEVRLAQNRIYIYRAGTAAQQITSVENISFDDEALSRAPASYIKAILDDRIWHNESEEVCTGIRQRLFKVIPLSALPTERRYLFDCFISLCEAGREQEALDWMEQSSSVNELAELAVPRFARFGNIHFYPPYKGFYYLHRVARALPPAHFPELLARVSATDGWILLREVLRIKSCPHLEALRRVCGEDGDDFLALLHHLDFCPDQLLPEYPDSPEVISLLLDIALVLDQRGHSESNFCWSITRILGRNLRDSGKMGDALIQRLVKLAFDDINNIELLRKGMTHVKDSDMFGGKVEKLKYLRVALSEDHQRKNGEVIKLVLKESTKIALKLQATESLGKSFVKAVDGRQLFLNKTSTKIRKYDREIYKAYKDFKDLRASEFDLPSFS